ncbi:uncharacterized protein ASPGLDRAFT_26845 [Aspergillus glaucus CBS 516.65]|uniref:Uncharacterized protein n=1 Tax=Aspergillus glaucus CBS 516.65 TaxID=1160497 RepID=A0A1L9VH66_ASPGL|nr:hypothetical protein ASPGLDRAFT_26845 [Aspergillus glaucus CBS 516.65]OJJ83267.1 hypothetical protein ASPGLDRAFT_26845 [Aspergillus glaucus CBS 516.65]
MVLRSMSTTHHTTFPKTREEYRARQKESIRKSLLKEANLNKALQAASQSEKHRENAVQYRKIVLDTELSVVQNSATFAGNIVRDIECIEQAQNEDDPRVDARKATFRKLYKVSYDDREDVLKAPQALVDTCNMLWSSKVVYPWAEHDEVARYCTTLDELIFGWEVARREGKGDEYWELGHVVSTFNDMKEWYEYGVYGIPE